MLTLSTLCIKHCENSCIYLCFCSGCYDSYIYTLNASTGEIFWKYQTGDAVKSSPCLEPVTGSVYIGSHDHCVYALQVQVNSPRVLPNSLFIKVLKDVFDTSDAADKYSTANFFVSFHLNIELL